MRQGGLIRAAVVRSGLALLDAIDLWHLGYSCRLLQQGEAGMAFVRAARTAEILPGTIKDVQLDGTEVALANVDGKFYAISNTCLHRGGPLGQGDRKSTRLNSSH